MGRKTQPLEVHQPRKDPEPRHETAAKPQAEKQEHVSGGVTLKSILNCILGRGSHDTQQQQPKKYYFWENWKTCCENWKTRWKNWKVTSSKWEAIEKFTFVLLIFTFFSSASDVYQSYMMRETLVASQRPALYLGLPGGKVADFVTEEGKEEVALHFQNYGPTAARNTFIETWPIVFLRDGPPVEVKIPPPKGRTGGPDVPPGFPTVHYQPYPGATREELEAGTKLLVIVGRIRYADDSRTYCEAFSLGYTRRVSPRFTPIISHHPTPCDRFTDWITMQSKKTEERARTEPAQ